MRTPFKAAALVAFAAVSFTVAPAYAGLSDCGDIDVQANATCTVEHVCDAKCTPVSFNAACAGTLEASCESQCNLPSVSCSGSCEATCSSECTAKPADFSCEGNCRGTCEGTCSAKCDSASDKTACAAQCQATCGGECQVSCKGQPATVDCAGKCQASCQGSCKADVNMDCQTQCQAQGFADCQARLQGGCTVQCKAPDGAIFCDGQYVDNGGHGQACLDALKAYLDSHVVADASGSCSGNTCSGQANAAISCQFSPPAAGGLGGGSIALAGLAFAVGVTRRRARRG